MESLCKSAFAAGTFPCEGSTLPFWRTELHELDSHHSTEELPELCDVLIIGGGYSGIAAAYNLLCGEDANRRPKLSIVLVEAREACSGATACNGASSLFDEQAITIVQTNKRLQVVIFALRSIVDYLIT
jgi:NADH dehydrogenase FAD-containing subunit